LSTPIGPKASGGCSMAMFTRKVASDYSKWDDIDLNIDSDGDA
jgi:hypothetical protein